MEINPRTLSILIFWVTTFLSGTHSRNCTEKTISTLLTLSCTGYEEIPKDIKEDDQNVIKSLDMSLGNKIPQLNDKDFDTQQFINIQKLTLSNCGLRQIEDKALSGLIGLTDLDLSNNHIVDLTLQVFSNNTKMKILNLANNKNLTELRGQFPPILSLTILDLSNCNLSRLHENIFHKLTSLQKLYLDGNSLKTLSPELRKPLHKLDTLTLRNNPWNCTCHLKEFVKSYFTAKSITNQGKPMCYSPPIMANKTWDEVDYQQFSCVPKIEYITVNEKVDLNEDKNVVYSYQSGENVTIVCDIWADPPADVNWRKNDVTMTSTNNDRHKIEISYDEEKGLKRMSTLTIANSEKQDTGTYQCHAENRGGAVWHTVTVNVTSLYIPPPILTGGRSSKVWLWVLIGVLCSAMVIAIIVSIVFVLWRRQRKQQKIFQKEVMEKFKGSQNVVDQVDKDEKRGDRTPLLPGNDTPTSVNASATETASFSHIDYRQQEHLQFQSQMQRSVPPSPSFYGRMVPSRPGSSNSVFLDADNRRQAFQNQKIDMMNFDTVRYQRRPPSVESFMSLPFPETHRMPNGYVTLPRKPRNPRWSTSTAMTDDNFHSVGGRPTSSSSMQPMGMYSTLPYKRPANRRPTFLTGPNYDTVGPRTTADGGSTLSLNKISGGSMSALDSINTALNNSHSRGKIVAKKSRSNGNILTPGTGRTSLHSQFSFDPIEEVESTPATSEINISVGKPRAKEDSNTQGPKYKKKKPPNLANLNRIKTPSNFHQRISEINKSFERPKSASEILSKETEINNTTTDSESNNKRLFPKPPPKPGRALSAPEYNDSNNSVMFGVIQEEAEGTAV